MPSLSADDPNYDPLGGYWLGGVWAPTNYMVTTGLEKYGRGDLAREIAVKHINAMIETMQDDNYKSIWECYSPEYMRPATNASGNMVRKNFIGWSGLGPVGMLIENIFGFAFDAADNRISWNIRTDGEHGIRNLAFNNKRVSLICHNSDPMVHTRKITIETSGELNISITLLGKKVEKFLSLTPGQHSMIL